MKTSFKAAVLIMAALCLAEPMAALPAHAETCATSSVQDGYTGKIGWVQNRDGKKMYLKTGGVPVKSTWLTISKKKYYFNAAGYMVTGTTEIDGVYYSFSDTGVFEKKLTGWCDTVLSDGGWVYLSSEGKMMTGRVKVGGKYYYLDPASGRMASGGWWMAYTDAAHTSGSLIYVNNSGVILSGKEKDASGWITVSSVDPDSWDVVTHKAYFKDGALLTNCWKWVDKKCYYFGDDGLALAGGSYVIDGKAYSFAANGTWISSKSGWVSYTDDNGVKQWAYNDENGVSAKGWKTIGGSIYYFGTNGTMVYGVNTIHGLQYFFKDDGKLIEGVTGWIKVSENDDKAYKHWYWLDDDEKPVTGWKTIGSHTYYFTADGSAASGAYNIGGSIYYFYTTDTSAHPLCSMAKGWITDDKGRKMYLGSDGKAVKSAWKKLDGAWYYFDASGIMETDWVYVSKKWYHFRSDGKMSTGVKKIGSKFYAFSADGELLTGLTGWQKLGYADKPSVTKKYYFESGSPVTGWKQIDKKWYYFYSSTAAMKTGWLTLDGKKYYLDSDGIMKTGWQSIDGKWYYFDAAGVMKTGWLTLDGKKYYFDSEGIMKTGWQSIGGKWYYFSSGGVMKTGWIMVSKQKYYLDKYGVMKCGWQSIGGNWYYFSSNGVMKTGWLTLNGKKYYLDSDGIMKTGWLKLSEKWYYFKEDGSMAVSEKVTVGKKTYKFDENGVWVS